jgi:LacI family transcriptional regulator
LRRVTLRNVAHEARVSPSTVSLYLRGLPGVSFDAQSRIGAAIEKLGYRPRSNNSHTQRRLVGLVVERLPLPVFSDLFYAEVMQGLQEEANRLGFSTIFTSIDKQSLLDVVGDEHAEGWLILGGGNITDAEIRAAHAKGIHFVLIDNYTRELDVSCVVPDNITGGYLAIQHLVKLGHRRIAVLCGPAKYKTLTDRLNGALLAAREAGLTPDQLYVQPPLSSGRPKKGILELQAVLESGFAPTAIFAVSDKTAFGAYEAASAAGLRIPGDLSIIGFDDLANSLHAEPPLTTIRIPKREFGVVAIQTLIDLLNNRSTVPTKTLIYTSLLVRESTAPPKSSLGKASLTKNEAKS